MTRHFLTLLDLSTGELDWILKRASVLKAFRRKGEPHERSLLGKSIAILLEKVSTRTRLSFEIAAFELGAYPVVLIGRDTQLARGEPVEDTARMLNAYVHLVVYRTFGHDRLKALAQYSSIPVVNGLSDTHHPCQLLADLLTIGECFQRKGAELNGIRVAWVGDGNNVAHSWIEAAVLTGIELTLACPVGYGPNPSILNHALSKGARVQLTENPLLAIKGAHVVVTDVWASMGQEEEEFHRKAAFKGFTVDQNLMSLAAPNAIFLHCLPAHRGEEVTSEVIDGPQSRVWEEAENRLHTQKAILEWLLLGPHE
ncbi:MAG: ornithine carbamoyltransferase [Sandaracinaceae bacterium]|nr:ornithine carbamoyltransferase [Sandaracinaceae bacterium]MDW8245370.1 ornithine carbamoyltransferase [Sandaracinaceae bacterium]